MENYVINFSTYLGRIMGTSWLDRVKELFELGASEFGSN